MSLAPTRQALAALSARSLLDAEGADLVTEQQLAALTQVSPKTYANWRSRREGPPFVRFGSTVRYSRAAVSAWLELQAVVFEGAA